MTTKQKSDLEKLLHEACVLRDGEKCLRCGRQTNLQASHIYPKGTNQRMRFLLDNVKTLCWSCHFNFWHKHPVAAAAWLKTVLPASRLKRLKDMSNADLPRPEYQEIKDRLTREIEKYRKPPLWIVIRNLLTK